MGHDDMQMRSMTESSQQESTGTGPMRYLGPEASVLEAMRAGCKVILSAWQAHGGDVHCPSKFILLPTPNFHVFESIAGSEVLPPSRSPRIVDIHHLSSGCLRVVPWHVGALLFANPRGNVRTRRSEELSTRVFAALPLARVDDVATAVDLSARQLQRWFQAHCGAAAKDVLSAYRLNEALSLCIASANLPLSHLAASAGYADQSHFARDIRQAFGATPTEMIKLLQQHPPTLL